MHILKYFGRPVQFGPGVVRPTQLFYIWRFICCVNFTNLKDTGGHSLRPDANISAVLYSLGEGRFMKARKRQMVNISQHATWRWEQLKWPLCAAVCLKEPAREQDDRCNLHSCALDHLVQIEQLNTVAEVSLQNYTHIPTICT